MRTPRPRSTSRSERVSVAPIGAAFALIGLFLGAWAVTTPEIERALGGGPGRLGAVLTAALVAAAALNTWGGALAERLGTTRALVLTLAGWSVTLVLGALFPAGWGVAIAVVVAMAASGPLDVVANVGATAAFADRPGRLVRLHATFNVGGAGGAVLAGVLLAAVGPSAWRVGWLVVAGVACGLAVTVAGRRLPAGRAGARVRLGDGLRALRRGRLVPVAAAFALGAMVEGGIGTWGVLQLRGQLGAGLLVGAGGAVLGFLVATVTRLAVGGVQSASGARRVIVAGSLLAAVGLGVLASVRQPVVAAAGLVVAAGGVSVCWPLLMAEVGRGRDRPGVLVGAVTAIGYLGAVVGPGLIGAVAGWLGLPAGLWLLAGCIAAVPALLAFRPTEPAG